MKSGLSKKNVKNPLTIPLASAIIQNVKRNKKSTEKRKGEKIMATYFNAPENFNFDTATLRKLATADRRLRSTYGNRSITRSQITEVLEQVWPRLRRNAWSHTASDAPSLDTLLKYGIIAIEERTTYSVNILKDKWDDELAVVSSETINELTRQIENSDKIPNELIDFVVDHIKDSTDEQERKRFYYSINPEDFCARYREIMEKVYRNMTSCF
jgi:hypothetical protein